MQNSSKPLKNHTFSHHTLLVSNQSDVVESISMALADSEYAIQEPLQSLSQLSISQHLTNMTMLIIAVDRCDSDMMMMIELLLSEKPLPIVIFTKTYDAVAQQKAIQIGVAAFVVDGLQTSRLLPLLQLATIRFAQQRSLMEQVDTLRTQLAERKIIDRAKGLLMQQRQCSEDEAYKLLRTTAMNKNMRLAMLAQQVLSAATLLEPAHS
ncbi:ANTAR domain-containing response regulator [Methylophaga sp. OBS3]|uniref:ANTAR domain-containing response regulator n=1 Tax=Methylophaga sp. OBS3 TaxID=2991934 RepID=UPI002259B98C|nr:ANTAR domain-containing protein [Methylophaga sp. OBS3]MCX4188875.1 ANTAR domain-containing protein [Methylophaga sp. OBS3]